MKGNLHHLRILANTITVQGVDTIPFNLGQTTICLGNKVTFPEVRKSRKHKKFDFVLALD